MFGWMGRILRVNLSKGTCTVDPLEPNLAQSFIGGRGLGTRFLSDEIIPRVDPLAVNNRLIFLTGPLTGTGAITGSRYMVITKSPLTNAIACSNSGGYFGPGLKFAGYDGIVIDGKSPEPVYLSIKDNDVVIKPADHLWGLSTVETERMLRSEMPDGRRPARVRIAAIGPAGENLVKMACIVNDNRTAARSGVGAVMGSKNLKAITVLGTKRPLIADRQGFKNAKSDFVKYYKEFRRNEFVARSTYGTWRIIPIMSELGMLPTRNFTQGFINGLDEIEEIRKKILVKEESCFACPFRCGRETRTDDPKFEGKGKGPEYESFVQLGPCCGITNLAAITKANYLCNELGMDTISVGVTIACAMELYEKGYIPQNDVPFPIHFGDEEALIKLIRLIAYREGFGNQLADGSYRLAEYYGHPEVSMSVKKQELPAIHPQGYQAGGLAFATSNSGACHTRSGLRFEKRFETLNQASVTKKDQDFIAVVDSCGLCWCIFGSFGMLKEELLTELELVTGYGYTEKTMMLTGERIFNLERLFNLKAGLTSKDDTLPKRFLEQPMLGGQAEGCVVQLEDMLPEYYRARGWDENGVPLPEKLSQLGLSADL